MGARPIANLKMRSVLAVRGIQKRDIWWPAWLRALGGYGKLCRCADGRGRVQFPPSYDGNILVNAMTVGIARADRIFYSAAAGPGNPVIYVGAKTGRDGIHGATMASAEFSDDSEAKTPDGAGWRSLYARHC